MGRSPGRIDCRGACFPFRRLAKSSERSISDSSRSRSSVVVLTLVPRLREDAEKWAVARLSRSDQGGRKVLAGESDCREGGAGKRSTSAWEVRNSEDRGLGGLCLAAMGL